MKLDRLTISAFLVSFALTQLCLAGDVLDQITDEIRQGTFFQSDDGKTSLDFDFYTTVDNWVVSQPPPGIMQTGENYLNSPRLSMLGTFNVNEWMSIFALGNVDRGFDPTDESIQIRPDIYFVKLNPFDGIAKGLFGKTQTTYGQWANRHFSWNNPLVNAPLTYEWLTTALGSGSNAGKLGSKKLAANRNTWVPVIWGPSYTTGGQFTGTIDVFDYGFEIKNTALSSAPDEWDLWNHGFYGDALTYSGRVGWRPRTDWNLGISGSTGSYLTPNSVADWQSYKQNVAGADISWAHGPLEVWSEVNWSSFDVRRGINSQAGTVGLVSYFVESKWKFAPSWWLAGRWNQQLYGDKPNSNEQWDNNVWRIDACLGWRLDRSLTVKTQVSYTDEQGPNPTSGGVSLPNKQGEYLFDLQLVFSF